MPASNYAMNIILSSLFEDNDYTSPATIYFGVSTVALGATVVEASITEPSDAPVSDGSYARISKTANVFWTPDPPTAQTIASDDDVEFATSTEDWGTIASLFIADHASAGNILWYYNFSPVITVGDNTDLSFLTGTIITSMS